MPGGKGARGDDAVAAATTAPPKGGPGGHGTMRPRSPFQGQRAGVRWVLFVDSPGGHCTERLRVVRGVESYENLAELSDDEAVTAARAAWRQRSQRHLDIATPDTAKPNEDAAIPMHSLRSKGPPRTKTKKTKQSSGIGSVAATGAAHHAERSLDDLLFAVSNHSTRRPTSHPTTKPTATTALRKSNHESTDDEATEENDSLLAVMELHSLASGTDDSQTGQPSTVRRTTTGVAPLRTTSTNTALSEDDTIVGSDRWSVADDSCNPLSLGAAETTAPAGWDTVELPGLWAADPDGLDEASDDDEAECNLLGEADEYWSSLCHKDKEALEQRLDGIHLDDTKVTKKALHSSGKADARDTAKPRPNDETCDKRKSRRVHTRRSEEEKATLTSSDEDRHVAGDAPRLSHKRASQKGDESGKVPAVGESQKSPSKRVDKKSESEKKQGRPKKDAQKSTKTIELEGNIKSLEATLPCPAHLQDSTFAFADEEQSIDPLANFSQRRPLQRLLSPPGKTRPKKDQSLMARVNISPRKQRREPQPFQTTANDESQSEASSGSEGGSGKNRSSNPYLEQQRRREGASSSGELHAGAVPTQHSLDRNNACGESLQMSDLSAVPKGQVDNSMSTMGESGVGYSNRTTLQLLERSATSSGDESSESNTSGYSFGAGLRHLNPNINLNGLLDAKAKGQFVQLNLEGKEGVQVVDSLQVRSEHRSGLHQRKVVPDNYLARSFSQMNYDETATEKVTEEHNRSSMGKMLSDMNMKNFRRSSTNKQTKFADNILAFGGRRSKNAENMVAPPEVLEGDHHEGKKFFGRNSMQKSRSDRQLLVDDDGSSCLDS